MTIMARIFAIRGNKCYLCAKELDYETATVDHYIPKSKGGGNDILNLMPCCYKCNQKKGNKMPKYV